MALNAAPDEGICNIIEPCGTSAKSTTVPSLPSVTVGVRCTICGGVGMVIHWHLSRSASCARRPTAASFPSLAGCAASTTTAGKRQGRRSYWGNGASVTLSGKVTRVNPTRSMPAFTAQEGRPIIASGVALTPSATSGRISRATMETSGISRRCASSVIAGMTPLFAGCSRSKTHIERSAGCRRR